MGWQSHPSVVPLLLGSALLWVNVGYLLWRRQAGRRTPGQLLAAGLVASFAISVGAFAVEQARTTMAAKIFWNEMQYVGDAPLVAFLLAYVVVYLGYDLSWRQYAGLFALPVVVFAGVVTNPLHGLHWPSHSLTDVGGYLVLANDLGPLFWLYTVYTYAFLIVSLVLLARAAVDAEGSYRRQLLALMGGTLLPGIGGVAYVFELGPTPTPNYVGYAYIGTALAFSYTVYRHDLFAAVPVARRTALEQLDDGLVTLDSHGVVVSVNDAASNQIGAENAALLGSPGREVLGPFVDAFDLDAPAVQDSPIETDRGVFDVSVSPLVRGEIIIGRQLLIRDVTDRHRREQRLTTLNTRLELALDETDTGVWEADLGTEELIFDEASERLFGYDPGEFPNTVEAFADRLSDADFEDVERRFQQAIDGDGEYSADFRVDLPDGSHRWVQARGVVQDGTDGTAGRMLGIQTNITDRKEAQRRLEDQNRRLELLNKLVRHDIRNEAFLISTLAGRLDDRRDRPADEVPSDSRDDRDHAERIAASSERIADLTQQAKELMSVISSLGDSLTVVPVAETLDREIAGASMLDAAATIRTEDVPTVGVRANEMLSPLFRNLLTNAIIHNDTDHPEVVVSGDRRGELVCITVADNGPGIPEADREAVFAEGKTLAGSTGTGFGLYLVDTLVEQYGGRVTITDDETLGGAAITVCLPIAEESDAD